MKHLLIVLGAAVALAPHDARPSLFSSYTTLKLRLEAPIDDLFARSRRNKEYSVPARLTYTGGDGAERSIEPVELSVRGHTSRQESECSFPKLRLRFRSGDQRKGSIFDGIGELNIGTHCGERADDALTARFGRLANEHTTHREAFIYQLLDVMDVPAPKARPARITYAAPSHELTRDAMLLETTGEAVKRLGGARPPADEFTDAGEQFGSEQGMRLAFAEAMIGNFDWCLKWFPSDHYRCDARHPLWNITIAAREDGTRIPVVHDFDLAGMVTGRHPWFATVFPRRFGEAMSEPEIEVLAQLEHARTLFTRAELDRARDEFLRHKDEAIRALKQADVDQAGKRIIFSYLDAFVRTIDSEQAFYRPMITRATPVYAEAARLRPVCVEAGPAPIGTLVDDVRSESGSGDETGKLVQVVVLDALWHWAPPVGCEAVRRGPVWIPRSAIGATEAAASHPR
jgi:hypothetical protein